MMHLIILTSKARDANINGHNRSRGRSGVDKISISGLGGQTNQMYHDLESKAKY